MAGPGLHHRHDGLGRRALSGRAFRSPTSRRSSPGSTAAASSTISPAAPAAISTSSRRSCRASISACSWEATTPPPSRQVVKHAKVTAEARVKTPANAEKVLSGGKADLVSIVRGQIADPHLANKAKEGRAADIRPCISCNQLCIGRRMRDYWLSCLVNPSAGREFEWGGDATRRAESPARSSRRRRRAGRAGGRAGGGRARPPGASG